MIELIVGTFLLFLSVKDLKNKSLPFGILLAGIAVGVIYSLKNTDISTTILNIIPAAIMCVFALVFPCCIGIGDGMIAVMYGLMYGWKKGCIWLLLGFWIAGTVGIVCNMFQLKKNIQLPFVPFLLLAHIGVCL